ncbi:MAG: endonuclease/exonuclease/phosphatase family protein [Bdellovibrionales bacterium]|nr:endonuclease/exonuclease/phosphatase family protein [Bdellovibrionales bacterium]
MLRILTVNIHKGVTFLKGRLVLHELREALRAAAADVVFLQEVVGENVLKAERYEQWPETPHYEFLADELWSDYAYAKNAVYPAGHHGNAILSKFPIAEFEQLDISAHRAEQRGLLWCELQYNDGSRVVPIHLVCVHLGLLLSWRLYQLERLQRFVTRRVPTDAPLIVAGDFNDWTRAAHAEFAVPLGLEEAFRVARGDYARTYPARLPLLRTDRIYCRGFSIEATSVLADQTWRKLSDHVALTATLTLLP